VYVSPAVANHFSNIRRRGETFVIGHGIHTDHFRPAPDPALRSSERAKFGIAPHTKLACFVGRLTLSKGISVIEHIAKLRPDWHFAVAGAGPVDPSTWGLSNVHLLGHLDIRELARLYQMSDLLVLPSQSESFSLVIREALASGCRVLSAQQILATDSNLSSFLTVRPVNLADIATTATVFADALDTAAMFDSCSDARAYVVKHCSWQAIVLRYSTMIEELAQTYRHSTTNSGS
jgi:alpha-maltose-1-phosphate synthase